MTERIDEKDLPLTNAAPTDELRAVRGGKSVRVPIGSLPPSQSVQDEIDQIRGIATGSPIPYEEYADLPNTEPEDGKRIVRVTNDADPDKNGTYAWYPGAPDWEKIPDELADLADEVATKADGSLIKADGSDEVAVAITFEDRSRTWLEADWSGRPTAHATDLIGDAVGVKPTGYIEGVAVAFHYPDTGDFLFGIDHDGMPVVVGRTPYVSVWPAVAYGDSTTYGADLSNPAVERWTTHLASLVGRPIFNMGISGARAEEIQARFGSISASMTTAAGVIPASSTVVLTSVDINPVRLGGPLPVELLCEGGERVPGTLSYASNTTAVFTRAAPGDEVATSRVRVISRLGEQHRRRLMFLGQGINNESLLANGDQTISQIKSWYRAASNHQSPAKSHLVVWGLLDRGVTEGAGTTNGDFIRAMETWLAEEYGNAFCPVRQFLASSYAFDIAELFDSGFSPDSNDTAAVAAETIPPCFRVNAGSVHLNALGHQLQAWFMHQHLIARGLV